MAIRQSSRISARNHLDDAAVADELLHPLTPAIKKKTGAEATRDWKQKMKTNNSEMYAAYMVRSKDYARNYRKNLTDDQRAISNQQAASRMRIMRKKKNETGEKKAPVTRAACEEQQHKWKEQKRRQQEKLRATLTPQEHAQLWGQKNKRRRESYHAKKLGAGGTCKNATSCSKDVISRQLPSCSGIEGKIKSRTPVSKRKALSRAKAALPLSPRKFFHTVNDLIATASPRKRVLFQLSEKKTPQHRIGENVLKHLRGLQKRRKKASHQTRASLLSVCSKYSSIRASSTLYNISRKTATKYCASSQPVTETENPGSSEANKRKRKLESEVSAYMETISQPLPDKKLVSKKTGKSASIMPKPLKDVHADFLKSTGHIISFSQFAKCRPTHVRTARQSRLRLCLCEYCTNVELKLRVINSTAARMSNKSRIRHIYHSVDIITCGRQAGGVNSWKQACVLQQCDQCSVDQLDLHLRPLHHQGLVTWTKWETVPSVFDGKTINRKMLVKKTNSWPFFLDELRAEVAFLAGHLFRAEWQHLQFEKMRNSSPFPCRTVGMVLDFAENFTCLSQDEVQAAHWHHTQVTVHPVVTYYPCELCEKTVTESLVFISNDRHHDFDAVHKFTEVSINHLRTTRGITLENIIQWTDGCASQYKFKGPFADISCALEDFGCTFELNFFGSRHGKGPSDGESAVVKHHASTAIKTGAAFIGDAKDLFDFCSQSKLNKQPSDEGCTHFRRSFFYICSDDIRRNRGRSVRTLKGTRALHSVKCVEPHTVLTRKLSCFCDACSSGIGDCQNADIVEAWKRELLKPAAKPTQDNQDEPTAAVTNNQDEPTAAVPPLVETIAIPQVEFSVNAHQITTENLGVGVFIEIKIEGRQRSVGFYAKILEIDQGSGDIKVHFLRKKPATDSYVWADVAWSSVDQVICVVDSPTLAPGLGISFIFSK